MDKAFETVGKIKGYGIHMVIEISTFITLLAAGLYGHRPALLFSRARRLSTFGPMSHNFPHFNFLMRIMYIGQGVLVLFSTRGSPPLTMQTALAIT